MLKKITFLLAVIVLLSGLSIFGPGCLNLNVGSDAVNVNGKTYGYGRSSCSDNGKKDDDKKDDDDDDYDD